ncbi:MAG TPA: hypothetical protein VFT99_12620 [Roseiflexaceae bacterium]|nr:hypothetical protein [Roseiflexaceae bacterium]
MLLAGTIALGLVWGWLAAGVVRRRRWRASVVALAGLAVQGLLLPSAIASLPVWYAGAVLAGMWLHLGWLQSIARRYS